MFRDNAIMSLEITNNSNNIMLNYYETTFNSISWKRIPHDLIPHVVIIYKLIDNMDTFCVAYYS